VVGVHSDAEVKTAKGTFPVSPETERYAAVTACKFVDEVIEDAPYSPTKEWIDKLRKTYAIDYIVHGDDPCFNPDGSDVYAYAKELNMFKIIKRTEGVSTTDIVGRMLLMTREHHVRSPTPLASDGHIIRMRSSSWADDAQGFSVSDRSQFLPTARRIRQFASDRVPAEHDTVVYIAGAFDLFTQGHIDALKMAKSLGTFLVVGVYDDEVVNKSRGGGHPIMNLHERCLSVLSCRYADEIIMGAPRRVSEDLICSMNVSVVTHGSVSEGLYMDKFPNNGETEESDPLAVAKKLDLFRPFQSPSQVLVKDIISRVLQHRDALAAKVARKNSQEREYYDQSKRYVSES
jgi:ethanolamine-phosphate cytidylyltransferase